MFTMPDQEALIAAINKHLAPFECEIGSVCEAGRTGYRIVDLSDGRIIVDNLDLEKFAKANGVTIE